MSTKAKQAQPGYLLRRVGSIYDNLSKVDIWVRNDSKQERKIASVIIPDTLWDNDEALKAIINSTVETIVNNQSTLNGQ